MSATKWYAQFNLQSVGLEPTHTLFCILPCTVDKPVLIPGWKQLGRTRSSYAEAVQDTIDWLQTQKSFLPTVGVELPDQVLQTIRDQERGRKR